MKLFLLLLAVCSIVSQKVCNLRIAENKMSVFKGNDIIFDNGRLNENRYSINAIVPYISEVSKDIEYLYAWEIHTGNEQHKPIVTHSLIQYFNITANDTSLVNPEIKITNDLSSEIYLTTLEVIYNCRASNGNAKIRLNVVADNCDPIDIYWIKTCSQKSTNL